MKPDKRTLQMIEGTGPEVDLFPGLGYARLTWSFKDNAKLVARGRYLITNSPDIDRPQNTIYYRIYPDGNESGQYYHFIPKRVTITLPNNPVEVHYEDTTEGQRIWLDQLHLGSMAQAKAALGCLRYFYGLFEFKQAQHGGRPSKLEQLYREWEDNLESPRPLTIMRFSAEKKISRSTLTLAIRQHQKKKKAST